MKLKRSGAREPASTQPAQNVTNIVTAKRAQPEAELIQETISSMQTRYGLAIRPLSLIERAPAVLTVPLKVPEPLDSGLALEASIENPPSATRVVVWAVPQTLPTALIVCA